MEQNINPCKCGSVEFITEPNQYDVYQIIDGKLQFIESLFIEDDQKLFCRECSEEIKISNL
jgi:hypothetical protein